MTRKKPVGWRGESWRHAQAARGIRTKKLTAVEKELRERTIEFLKESEPVEPNMKLVPIDPTLDFTEALRSLSPGAKPIKVTKSVKTRLPPGPEGVQKRMGELIGNVFARRAKLFEESIDVMNKLGLLEIARDLDTGGLSHAWDEISRLRTIAERRGSQADIDRLRKARRQMVLLMPTWADLDEWTD